MKLNFLAKVCFETCFQINRIECVMWSIVVDLRKRKRITSKKSCMCALQSVFSKWQKHDFFLFSNVFLHISPVHFARLPITSQLYFTSFHFDCIQIAISQPIHQVSLNNFWIFQRSFEYFIIHFHEKRARFIMPCARFHFGMYCVWCGTTLAFICVYYCAMKMREVVIFIVSMQ